MLKKLYSRRTECYINIHLIYNALSLNIIGIINCKKNHIVTSKLSLINMLLLHLKQCELMSSISTFIRIISRWTLVTSDGTLQESIMNDTSSASTGWHKLDLCLNAHVLEPATTYNLVYEYGYSDSKYRSKSEYPIETCDIPKEGHCGRAGYYFFYCIMLL